ncbi:MAG TPA: hypothetical protein PLA16_02165 [Chitinophagales bacterium]|jgi:hypothetical protein|nr:hypothetical protein [Chitinophagales bacterium]HPA35140.1 hypothetical protein [Chitinophagales bacterium]HPW86095.1 hypothetical protein [Chitinophagales bacterium]HQD11542.1 hypothetical protein [Chitinophagales bacterium]HQO31135.1 hypothetical protein [Chitinophagales bacterium]
MIKKYLTALSFILFAQAISLQAQEYNGAIGIRMGYGWGVSGKYFFNGGRNSNGHALEALLRYGYHGVVFTQPGINATVLYEKHFPLGRTRNWSFIVGAGPGMGFGKKGNVRTFAFGVAPIIGVDVLIKRFPINFSVDYKPTFFVDKVLKTAGSKFVFSYYELALSMRYAFTNGGGRRRR